LQWSRTGGGYNHEDEAAAVAVGADDSIVMAGTMLAGVNWPASYGGPSFTGAAIDDNRDAFVAKYTSAGVHVWSHAFGGPSTDDAPFAVVGTDRRNVTTFNDVVRSGVTYDYQVRARGRRSVVSAPSPIKTVKVTPPDGPKPATPQGVVATAISCADLKVTWNFVLPNPQGPGIAGYNVRRGTQVWFVPFGAPLRYT